MTQKEKFLQLTCYEEFDKRREEFRGMPLDDEIGKHMDVVFGRPKNPLPKDGWHVDYLVLKGEDPVLDGMIELQADGVDFVKDDEHFQNGEYEKCKVVDSYEKVEWIDNYDRFPKPPYIYYKIVDGKKVYCGQDNKNR